MAEDRIAESGEEEIDETGRNPTQRRLDDEEQGGSELPADVDWEAPPGKDEPAPA